MTQKQNRYSKDELLIALGTCDSVKLAIIIIGKSLDSNFEVTKIKTDVK